MDQYRRDLNKITNVVSILLVFELILLDDDVLHLVIEPNNLEIRTMKRPNILPVQQLDLAYVYVLIDLEISLSRNMKIKNRNIIN